MFMGTEFNICPLSVCTQDVFIEIYVQSFCNKQLIETMNIKVWFVCHKTVGDDLCLSETEHE